MKYKYREINLNRERTARLARINAIIEEYQNAGYVLTLRQLYYQLVSRDVIPNRQNEYKKLGDLLTEARMGGLVDWNAIEDRLRSAEKPSSWDNPGSILDSAIHSYARPRMEGQPYYIEVWVEKDALSGVLSRVTEQYHIPICVNRGYSSASAMHEAFKRFRSAYRDKQAIRILYLGDFDPSGVDMIRDVEDRIREFFRGYSRAMSHNVDFEVMPIALTRPQITEYEPPPNPAKQTDSRFERFAAEHGTTSWEVDALPPEVLNQILTDAILELLDIDQYQSMLSAEAVDKANLIKLKNTFFGETEDNDENE